jgi:S1-C subfamily serine protease
MRDLIETGTVPRGFLGVGVQELTPDLAEGLNVREIRGVVINSLTPDGPAARAGLKLEDMIVAINDQPVDSLQTLRLVIAQTPPGTNVKVKSLRGGKPVDVEVALGRLAGDRAAPDGFLPGVSVSRATDELRRTYRLPDDADGLVVTEVSDDSPYREKFRPGMFIVQVNRAPADDVATVRAQLRPGRNFCLVWDRGGYRFIPFQMQ